MYLMKLMDDHNMNRADLSRLSGIPESTLRDILNGKARLDRCAAGTLCAIAKALGTTVEEILQHDDRQAKEQTLIHDSESMLYFYTMVDASMIKLGRIGEVAFIEEIYRENWIERFIISGSWRMGLFLLGLTDYLSRKNQLELNPEFDPCRDFCLDQPVYSMATLDDDDDPEYFAKAKARAERSAVPELARFNIFMTERDLDPDYQV